METKHFTSKDVPMKFAHKHGSSNTIWIVLISVLFFLFLIFSKWNKIEELFGFSVENVGIESGFVMGEQVSVEGILTQDGDFVTHTHKLSTLSSGVFGLKSKKINLNQYSGTVLIEGIIDSQHEGLYIIDVDQIIAQFDDQGLTGDQQTGEIVPSGQYLSGMGIYLSPSFFEEYSIISADKNSLQVKSSNSDSIIKIDYFLCKRGDTNADCKQLTSTFSNSNEKTFTTQYATTYYKLSEVDSWFFANQENFGYFINDVSEQEVIKLSSYLTIPNGEYVKTTIQPNVSSICKQGNIVMNEIKKSNLLIEQGKLITKFVGTWEMGTAECKIELDLSLPLLGTVKSFTYEESVLSGDVKTTLDNAVNTNVIPSSSSDAVNVKQFPISLEKTLTFTSSRGHSIIFPSPKISYQSESISENLDLAGVNCYVATRVIEYSKKDLILSGSSLIVYECKIKNNVDIPNEYYIKPLDDGRTFLISVLDPAWHDFANNVQVVLN